MRGILAAILREPGAWRLDGSWLFFIAGLLLEPAGELRIGVGDAEEVGGAAAGVDAGGDKGGFFVHEAGVVLREDRAPVDAEAEVGEICGWTGRGPPCHRERRTIRQTEPVPLT
jgi:hypothetical protein